MDGLIRRLKDVQKKLLHMRQRMEALAADNHRLATQVSDLEAELRRKEATIADLQERYEAAKLVKHLNNPADREAIQVKIDHYLKQIDTCLKSFGD
ncbi:MAG: hypothetical protein OHK0039_35640 [Bacteroidia bacterium]